MQEIMQFVGRHPILSIAWIALLVAVLVTTFKSLTSKVKVITRGVTRLINKEDAVVVDLRQRDDFRKGHIAGSINLLPSEIKANNVGELEKHKDKPVIVVDGSGMQCGGASKRADESWFCASIRTERRRRWLGWRKLAFGARQIIYLSSFMMQAVSCN